MKKICMIISAVLALCLSVCFAGCSKEKLSAPANIYVDESDSLHWSAVENARSYEIEIAVPDGEASSRTSRRNLYSLSTLAEGDYDIRVRAVGLRDLRSEWSETFFFKKERDAGYSFRAIEDGTAWSLTSARSSSGDVKIPDLYRDKPILEIADGAFRNDQQVTSASFGKYVRTFGERVFYNCSELTSVVVPDSVRSFGVSNFQNCAKLEEVVLPASLTEIPSYTFAYCSSLKAFEISDKIESIGESAFYSCTSLKEVKIPDSVVSIGTYAFSRNDALTSAELGAGLESIGQAAFYRNALLSSVTFADSYARLEIADYAFGGCPSLESIRLPEGLSAIPASCFEEDSLLREIEIPASVNSVAQSAFLQTPLFTGEEETPVYVNDWLVYYPAKLRGAEDFTELGPSDFRAGTVGIASNVFQSSPNLDSVELPASVKYVGQYCFYNCTKLYSFTLEDGSLLERIDAYAFVNCTFLSSVWLTCPLKSIGNYAFYGCTVLNNNFNDPYLLVPKSVTSIGRDAFVGTALYARADAYGVIYAGGWVVGYDTTRPARAIILRDGTDPNTVAVSGIADYAFFIDETLQTIEGMGRVTNIGAWAFAGCTSLSQISLSSSLTVIKPMTFLQCTSLRTVGEFPFGLTEIGEYAFFQCDVLEKIDLAATQVTRIGNYAFFSCGAQSLTLPEGLEEIAPFTFCYNRLSGALTIPGSVKKIGGYAFFANALDSLTISEGTEEIGDYAFRISSNLTSLDLPDSVKKIGEGAFLQCMRLEDLHFGSGVEEIGAYAFGYARALKSLELPHNIGSIGEGAFLYCSLVPSVTLPESLGYLGPNAFYGCTQTTFYVPKENAPDTWSARWNSVYRPIVYGATLSEEGYVVSVPLSAVIDLTVYGGLKGPARAGWEFLGWSTAENATEADVASAEDLALLPAETTLYAVYRPLAQ